MNRTLARLLGLTALWAGVELLERVAYRAGVFDAGAAAVAVLDDAAATMLDDLEAFDATDVLDLCPDPTRHEHATAGGPA